MTTLSPDTRPEAKCIQIELLRQALAARAYGPPPHERVEEK